MVVTRPVVYEVLSIVCLGIGVFYFFLGKGANTATFLVMSSIPLAVLGRGRG